MITDLTTRNLPSVWYHGTVHFYASDIKEEIKLKKSEPDLDFGQGFYLTSNPYQAWERASQKTKLHNMNRTRLLKKFPKKKIFQGRPSIVEFNLDLNALSSLEGRVIDLEDDDWALFILGNRSIKELEIIPEHNRDNKYHYVYGPMADGYGFSSIIEEAEETKDISTFLSHIVGKRSSIPNRKPAFYTHGTSKIMFNLERSDFIMSHPNPWENEYALRLIRSVKKLIIQNYGVSEQEAEDLIVGSSFLQLLKEDPEFVFHYSSRYWAGNISEEHELKVYAY